jgi:hypothetical protein
MVLHVLYVVYTHTHLKQGEPCGNRSIDHSCEKNAHHA